MMMKFFLPKETQKRRIKKSQNKIKFIKWGNITIKKLKLTLINSVNKRQWYQVERKAKIPVKPTLKCKVYKIQELCPNFKQRPSYQIQI